MAKIYDALDEPSDILFEGATGTGKTLASLTPALEYARETDKTVVITTNVHQQMRQFRRDASAIAQTEDIRAVVFRGKGSMCHIDVGYEECQALR
ncbi:MAG: DEAD/DEAH box helicase, partial [Halovenus sp.]